MNHYYNYNYLVFTVILKFSLFCSSRDAILSCCHGNSNSTADTAMASENISEFYAAVCAEQEIKINPHILQVLEETAVTQ